MPCEWRAAAADLGPIVLDTIRAGDVVVVKGSNGSRMGPVVAALKQHHAETLEATQETETSASRATA